MAAPFSPPLEPSEVQDALKGIKIRRVLGTGGQGTAFLADHESRGAVVAKIYSPGTEPARIEREIQKLGAVSSPHVAKLAAHGVATLRGQQLRFSCIEHIEGSDLRARTKHLDDTETRQLLSDVSSGIQALWKARVVHRDLTPANIMAASSGRFVIIDLGLAKHHDEDTVTMAGMTCGTAGYMAPEQAQGRRGLTFRADLFSLGVVAYEKASGSHPFMKQQGLIGRFNPRPISTISNLSDSTSELVMRLLSTDPMERAVVIRQVIAELKGT